MSSVEDTLGRNRAMEHKVRAWMPTVRHPADWGMWQLQSAAAALTTYNSEVRSLTAVNSAHASLCRAARIGSRDNSSTQTTTRTKGTGGVQLTLSRLSASPAECDFMSTERLRSSLQSSSSHFRRLVPRFSQLPNHSGIVLMLEWCRWNGTK